MKTVGDTLLFVYENNPHKETVVVTIEKVGRKWITVSPSYMPRIDRFTMRADGAGYSSPGRCYDSREAYTNYLDRQLVWSEIVKVVRKPHEAPPYLSLASLQTIMRMLEGGSDAD